jgi:hypothetical protein
MQMAFGKSRTRFSMVAFAIAALMFVVKPALADQIFYFSFSGTTVSGSGMLNAADNGDGTFTALNGTGTQNVNGVADALTLIFNPNGTTVANSPSGILFYDNQLFPGQDPLVSDAGLLFASSTQEVNLFSNLGGGYQFVQQDGFSESITFSLSDTPVQTVPEPASIILFSIGLIGFAALRRRLL